jgi:hypothetical protein
VNKNFQASLGTALLLAACNSQYNVSPSAVTTLQPEIRFSQPVPEQLAVDFYSGLLVVQQGERLQCRLQVALVAADATVLADIAARVQPSITEADAGQKVALSVPLPVGAPLAAMQTIWHLEVPDTTRLSVNTSSGTILIRGFRGDVSATTREGRVEAELDGGSATLRSESGNISLRGNYRIADLRTDSGRLDVLTPPPGIITDLTVADRHGDIWCNVQAGKSLDLEFQGELGLIRADPEVRVEWLQVLDIAGVEWHKGRLGDPAGLLDGRLQLQPGGVTHLRLAPPPVVRS